MDLIKKPEFSKEIIKAQDSTDKTGQLEKEKNEIISKIKELEKKYSYGDLLDEEFEELKKPLVEELKRLSGEDLKKAALLNIEEGKKNIKSMNTEIKQHEKGNFSLILLSVWTVLISLGEFIEKPFTFSIILIIIVYAILKRNKYIKYILIIYFVLGISGMLILSLDREYLNIGGISLWCIGLVLLYRFWNKFN